MLYTYKMTMHSILHTRGEDCMVELCFHSRDVVPVQICTGAAFPHLCRGAPLCSCTILVQSHTVCKLHQSEPLHHWAEAAQLSNGLHTGAGKLAPLCGSVAAPTVRCRCTTAPKWCLFLVVVKHLHSCAIRACTNSKMSLHQTEPFLFLSSREKY